MEKACFPVRLIYREHHTPHKRRSTSLRVLVLDLFTERPRRPSYSPQRILFIHPHKMWVPVLASEGPCGPSPRLLEGDLYKILQASFYEKARFVKVKS